MTCWSLDPASLHLLALLRECQTDGDLAASYGVLDAALQQRGGAVLDAGRARQRRRGSLDGVLGPDLTVPAPHKAAPASVEEQRAIDLLADDAVALHLAALLWRLHAATGDEDLTIAAIRSALDTRLIALGAGLDAADPMLPRSAPPRRRPAAVEQPANLRSRPSGRAGPISIPCTVPTLRLSRFGRRQAGGGARPP